MRALDSKISVYRLLVTGLVFHLGIETLRAILPLLVFGLRDRFGWSALGPIGAVLILLIALVLFSFTFSAGSLTRRLGRQTMLRCCVAGLVIFRLIAQLWSADPLGNLIAMALSLLCFLLFWLPWTNTPSASSSPQAHRKSVALGLLLGAVISATLHGLLLTYDAIWRQDLHHVVLSLGLTIPVLVLLWSLPEDAGSEPQAVAATWFTLGPFIFLQLLLFLNLARWTVLIGWSQSQTASFQVFSHGLAFAAAAGLAYCPLALGASRLVWALSSLMLLASVVVPWPLGWTAAAMHWVGTVAAAILWFASAAKAGGTTAGGATAGSRTAGSRTANRSHGIGMLILLFLLFLYYAGYDLPLPFQQVRLLPFAALLLAGAAWPRTSTSPNHSTLQRPELRLGGILATAAVLVVLPLAAEALRSTTRACKLPPETGLPLRVMTYNLHCGFGAEGYLRLEEQAEIIASMDADVVALQEISRGWIINGGVDVLAWLAQRLDMDYRFAPTADPLWGNATLSRRPIVASHLMDFPSGVKQQIRRGLVEITVSVDDLTVDQPTDDSLETSTTDGQGTGHLVTVINTHFHHRRADSDVRLGQAEKLIDFWDRSPHTLIVGDLNARPDSPEMQLLGTTGLVDTVQRHGISPGHTFRSNAPDRRIDYIWTTPDLHTDEATVVTSTASDHLAIVVQVNAEAASEEEPLVTTTDAASTDTATGDATAAEEELASSQDVDSPEAL